MALNQLRRYIAVDASFRSSMEAELVSRSFTRRKNVLDIFPTAAGKSMSFNLPALAEVLTTVVLALFNALVGDKVLKARSEHELIPDAWCPKLEWNASMQWYLAVSSHETYACSAAAADTWRKTKIIYPMTEK